ncbi:MAG: L-threonylcarbamoyladenylate synthase [Actinomycetota bacterium]
MTPILPAGDPASLDQAARALEQGQLVVLPTDTVYGLAARPDRPEALSAIFQAKGRPGGLALPVLAGSIEDAAALGVLTEEARALAEAFWPGALTLVVDRQPGFGAALGGDGVTVGLRMPADASALALLRRAGPLATTSANRSGELTPGTAEGVAAVFGNQVAVYLDGGPAPAGEAATPSTVLGLTGGSLKILREGALPASAVLAVLGRR